MFEIRTAIGVVMRMPEKIDQILLAPCGVNCLACYRHLVQKKHYRVYPYTIPLLGPPDPNRLVGGCGMA